ncbi:hypothetical protein MANES_11G158501v8 [Manihot esculenta]|uniref:Uncharacterized protein n=1 Tax=Manihot esculenta TaxID=3983 RepID=A0ACB7GWI4_MANES|nr:hypothetical protein MANES_11G158501v8 [Manihot esculenta]
MKSKNQKAVMSSPGDRKIMALAHKRKSFLPSIALSLVLLLLAISMLVSNNCFNRVQVEKPQMMSRPMPKMMFPQNNAQAVRSFVIGTETVRRLLAFVFGFQ